MEYASYTFYNAGNRIKEHIRFDNPYNHDNDNACKSFYALDLETKQFGSIPAQLTVGEAKVPVLFVDDILAKHGPKGVVLVNTNLKEEEIGEDAPLAASKEGAVKKAEKLWRLHLEEVANRHLNACQESLSKGGKPTPAYGFTAFALKELGISDPGAPATVVQNNHDEVAELRKQIAELTKLVTNKVSKG